ncbi:MAG TPA: hypothetical protein VMT03_01755 [Polyangia bacterium]|nr:hypothetical protein [Polyangia bacterium]
MPSQDSKTDDRLVVKIEGTSPSTVDAQAALRLAAAYLDLVRSVADEEGASLQFTGIQLLNESVGFAFHASAPDVAREAATRAARYVSGEDQPPRGAASATKSVKDALRHLPRQQSARVILGPWARELAIGTVTSDLPAESSLSVRARLIRAGGTKPAARFESASEERPFTLSLSIDLARKIGQFLYREMDIVAKVHRDTERLIEYGELLEFIPIADDDATAGWKDWYRDYSREWDQVKDIEAELGRHGH